MQLLCHELGSPSTLAKEVLLIKEYEEYASA
jgi:hypothetical protein